MEEAAAGKARLPTVESLTDGTMRRLVAAERRFRRLGTFQLQDMAVPRSVALIS